ncbi:MAG: hypothetical protein KDC95_14290 [Planctomycetes bacterium]|nr:hypothetical protein [Planctomycetota bacterium]
MEAPIPSRSRARGRASLTVMIAATIAMLASCSGLGINVDAGYTSLELTGDIGLTPTSISTIPPQRVDVEEGFGLKDAMSSPFGRVEAEVVVARIVASGFQIDQTGRGALSVQFGDIPLSTPIESTLEMTNLKGAILFDLLDLGPVRISPGIGADYFDLKLDARSLAVTTLRESLDATAPVPLIFVQGEVDLGYFDIVADVGAMKANVQDIDGTVLDVEVLARFRPIDHVELFAGYRHITLDVEGLADDNQKYLGDLTLRGFMVGGGIYF